MENQCQLNEYQKSIQGFNLPHSLPNGWNYGHIRQEIDAKTNAGIFWEVQLAKSSGSGWLTRHGRGDSPKQAAMNAIAEIQRAQ